MAQVIDTTKARESFSEIVNKVYYGGEEFIVKRQGVPVILISKFIQKKKIKKLTISSDFLSKLASYGMKGSPSDLAQNHDKYTWE